MKRRGFTLRSFMTPRKPALPRAAKKRTRIRPPPADGPKNRLLAALPADDYQQLRPFLRTVPIHVREVLLKAREPLDAVYFLNGGVGSMTTVLKNGAMVEVATVGDEGMIGIEAFLSAHPVAPGETLIQVPDAAASMNAERLEIKHFRHALDTRPAFHDLIARYAQVVFAQMMQSTACNALHPVPQRCARWLLQTHDRMHGRDFRLSHEYLAVMLGVQRPTVSVVAGALQKAGLIRYTHGLIAVVDRRGLEAASCECFAVIQGHYRRLLSSN
jgi:CRP-like cAMP-binding protein